MDVKPKKPDAKLLARNTDLDTAVAKSKNTPADTKALTAASKELEAANKALGAAMKASHKALEKAVKVGKDATKGPAPVPIPYPVFAKLEKETRGAVKLTEKALKVREKAQKKVDKVLDAQGKVLSKFANSKGDEAAALAGLVSAKAKAKGQFQQFSFDVKFEGKNVARAFDLMLHHDE